MAQLVYSASPALGYAGQVADLGVTDAISRAATVDIAVAGVLVVQGASDKLAKVPASTTDVTNLALGVVILQTVNEQSNTVAFPATSALSILRHGRIYVKVEEAVNALDNAFVRFASGAGGTQLGAFRKSADTATAVALPNAKYMTSAAANGIAVVELL